jgi:hypothetical protein
MGRVAVQAAEAIPGVTSAGYRARSPEPPGDAGSRPMDAWVDDTLRHMLDEL